MCYYRLYLFVGCGHSSMSSRPIKRCKRAREAHQQQHPHDSPQELGPMYHQVRQEDGIGGHDADRSDNSSTVSGGGDRPGMQAALDTVSDGDSDLTRARQSSDASSNRTRTIFTDSESVYSDHECNEKLIHPFQSYRIDRACPGCENRRVSRLAKIETGNEVRFEDWRWKVKYMSPVPEERYTEWGTNWGETMGSWVNEVKGKGVELGMGIMNAIGELEEGGESSRAHRGSGKKSVGGQVMIDAEEGRAGISGGFPRS
jgi:hypothetical protein